MSKITKFVPAALAALACAVPISASASESDVLLKILVRKGVLSQEEAAGVRAEVAKENAKEA